MPSLGNSENGKKVRGDLSETRQPTPPDVRRAITDEPLSTFHSGGLAGNGALRASTHDECPCPWIA
jgi:hypothetical protein